MSATSNGATSPPLIVGSATSKVVVLKNKFSNLLGATTANQTGLQACMLTQTRDNRAYPMGWYCRIQVDLGSAMGTDFKRTTGLLLSMLLGTGVTSVVLITKELNGRSYLLIRVRNGLSVQSYAGRPMAGGGLERQGPGKRRTAAIRKMA